MLLVFGAAACAAERPLGQTPILGGTPELRALIRDELRRFEDAIGPDRIHLRRIEVVDEVRGDGALAGTYVHRRIELREGDERPDWTLRHELCHAVHVQEGWLDDPDPFWDGVADDLFTQDVDYVTALATGHYDSADQRRHEAMAAFCEVGPTAWSVLRHACPGESPQQAAIAARLLDEVYREVPDRLPVVPGPVVVASGPPPVAPVLGPTDVAGVIWAGSDLIPGAAAFFRLADGAPATVAATLPSASDGPRVPGLFLGDRAGWADGPAAAWTATWLHHLGPSSLRLLAAERAAPWRMVDGACAATPDDALFTSGTGVFRSWTSDGALRWSSVAGP